MIERLYSRLDLQLAMLSVMLILSGLLSAFLGFSPLLRFSIANLFYGILGGIILILLRVGYVYVIHRQKWQRAMELELSKRQITNISLAEVIIQAAGEETLLRGFIFVPLITTFNFFGSSVLAFFVNALVSIGIYSNKEKIDYLAGIQATVLGIIYLCTYSLFAVVVARFVGEFALLVASHYKLPHLLLKRFSYVPNRAV